MLYALYRVRAIHCCLGCNHVARRYRRGRIPLPPRTLPGSTVRLLPAGHQVQLHRLIAMREEAGYGEHAGEVATELAHHYSRANDERKAIHYFQLAGQRAITRGAMIEAEDHYRDALSLLIELPQDTARDRRELAFKWRWAKSSGPQRAGRIRTRVNPMRAHCNWQKNSGRPLKSSEFYWPL